MAKEEKKAAKKQAMERTEPKTTLTPFDEMERLFSDMFSRHWMHPRRWEWPAWAEAQLPFSGQTPKVDVIEKDAEIVVRAEVPGVKKEDLDVSMTDNTVTIKGSTAHEEKEEKDDYYRCEIARGAFSRTVALPAAVDGAKAEAKMKDGVLEITLPKVQKSKRHTLEIGD